jgi:hypothetical protein
VNTFDAGLFGGSSSQAGRSTVHPIITLHASSGGSPAAASAAAGLVRGPPCPSAYQIEIDTGAQSPSAQLVTDPEYSAFAQGGSRVGIGTGSALLAASGASQGAGSLGNGEPLPAMKPYNS